MFTYTIAKTVEQMEVARSLISKMYHKVGYLPEDEEYSPIYQYLNKPGATTFLAYIKTKIVGTISVIQDSGELPMDTQFKDVLDVLRNENKKIAEISQFAIDRDTILNFSFNEHELSLNLLYLITQFSFEQNIQTYVFAVKHKHAKFYELLGALPLSEERTYGFANIIPVAAYKLDMRKLNTQISNSTIDSIVLKKLFAHPAPTLIQ
ncbi:MAG TPA: hypothetical protein VFV22_01650 [Candidatus Paceibacterota bacterium]|nr:hypothetical protein [Candidatus Paceibacterota bacterium]